MMIEIIDDLEIRDISSDDYYARENKLRNLIRVCEGNYCEIYPGFYKIKLIEGYAANTAGCIIEMKTGKIISHGIDKDQDIVDIIMLLAEEEQKKALPYNPDEPSTWVSTCNYR